MSVLSQKTANEIAEAHADAIIKDIEKVDGEPLSGICYRNARESLCDDVAWAICQVEIGDE